MGLDEAALAAGNYEVVSDALEYTLKDITASLAEGTHQVHPAGGGGRGRLPDGAARRACGAARWAAQEQGPGGGEHSEVIAGATTPSWGNGTGVLDLGRVLVHAPRIRTVLHTRKKDDQPSDRLPVGLSSGPFRPTWAGGPRPWWPSGMTCRGQLGPDVAGPDSRLDLQFPDVELGLEALAFRVGARATRERPLPARRVTAQFLGSQWKRTATACP